MPGILTPRPRGGKDNIGIQAFIEEKKEGISYI
jgi:hypothetical protein